MNWLLPKLNLKPNISVARKANRAEGFTSVSFYRNELPLHLTHTKLTTSRKWCAGRSSQGFRILRTRGRKLYKTRQHSINYRMRDSRISFFAGFFFKPESNKLFSVLFLSSGSITYVPSTTEHQIFRLLSFKSTLAQKLPELIDPISIIPPIVQAFFVIHQLPKNAPVCLLEIQPGRGVQYARGVGTKAKILKMDSRTGASIVLLPSGVKKMFSIYGLGSVGGVALPENRKMVNNRAGYRVSKGLKPTVRGVAMNPVDHPHGGRTKTLQHPRTPWGKTTKRK